jgi:undecaprenyl diphosphate synthase
MLQREGKRPNHVAIIMDGNGRWAESKGLARLEGHREGVNRVLEISRACRDLDIRVLTLYAFSSENWKRPQDEVSGLMVLLREFLRAHRAELIENKTRLNAIGDHSRIPADTLAELEKTIAETRHFDTYVLNIALSYGGRDEITRACRKLAEEVRTGERTVDSIDEQALSDRLDTAGLPDPDLMIRTSGEQRISNYMLWQLAYAEFMFPEVPWPEFTRDRLVECLDSFGNRERRFGMTGAQIKGPAA